MNPNETYPIHQFTNSQIYTEQQLLGKNYTPYRHAVERLLKEAKEEETKQ